MKYIFSTLLLFIYTISIGQSTGNPTNSTVVKPSTSSYFQKHRELDGNSFYQQLSREPENADAWLQLYQSLAKTKTIASNKKQVLAETVQAANIYVAESWQFSLMRFLQSGRRDSSSIHKALRSGGENKMLYSYAVQWALIAKNKQLLKEYCEVLYQLAPLSPVQYEYHYNSLMSAENNATIYAKGLTDLVPMLLLQQVLRIRPDIELEFYEENILPVAKAYLCLSLGKEIIQQHASAHYTGLLVKLKADETSSVLSQNLEEKFTWRQFEASSNLSDADKQLYQNYLPAMIVLYKQYLSIKDPRSASWKMKIEKLAALTGTTALVNKQIAP